MPEISREDLLQVVPTELYGRMITPAVERDADDYEVLGERMLYSPATGLIRRHIANARALGLNVTNPVILRRCIEAGEAEFENRPPPKPPTWPLRSVSMPFTRPRSPDVPPYGSVTDPPHTPIVYYMQTGNRIKIGTTANLLSRLASLMPEFLLAVELGGAKVERVRHAEFAQWRTRSEWFEASEPLLARIEQVRTKFEEAAGITLDAWLGGPSQRQRPPTSSVSIPNPSPAGHETAESNRSAGSASADPSSPCGPSTR